MIEILSYNEIKERRDNSKIIGFLDVKVKIGGSTGTEMIFTNIPHLEFENRKWVAFPTYSKINANGEKEFFKHWRFQSEEHNKKFLSKLNEKLKEFMSKEKQSYEMCF